MEHINRHKQLIKKDNLISKLIEQNVITQEQIDDMKEETIDDITEEDIDDITADKIDDVTEEKIDDVTEEKMDEFDTTMFYCWFNGNITGTGAPCTEYKIYLYFVDNDAVYEHSFNTTYKIIKEMYESAYRGKAKYFAIKRFPAFIETEDKYVRDHKLQTNMELMEKYMLLDSNFATEDDIDGICKILRQIFNSALFVAKPSLYSKFIIDNDVKTILQIIARYEWLFQLRQKAKKNLNRNPTLLYSKNEWKEKEFKRVYLVQRANGTSSTHWALKFEGDKDLFSVDWFDDDKCYYQILENDRKAIGQRICWYSSMEHTDFNEKWIELLRYDLEVVITCSDIGYLIDKWKEEYSEYETYDNNCQHFARDILSAFNINMAKNITKKSKKTFVAGIGAPVFQLTDMEQEMSRIDKMSQIFQTIISDEKHDEKQVREWLMNIVQINRFGITSDSIIIQHGFNKLERFMLITQDNKDEILSELGFHTIGNKLDIMHHIEQLKTFHEH